MKSSKKKSRVGKGPTAPPPPSLVKIVLVGDAEVGKSTLLKCFMGGSFSDEYIATIGVDFDSKLHPMPPPPAEPTANLKLQLWDTAGSERFGALTQSYYRGAAVALVVFDLVKADPDPDGDASDAFSKLEQRFMTLEAQSPDCLPFLVGTHLDVYRGLPQRQTDDPDGGAARLRSRVKERLTRWGKGDVPFYAVSSKDGTNVQALLNDVAHMWMERMATGGVRAQAHGLTREVLVQAPGWTVEGRPLPRVVQLLVLLEEAEKGTDAKDPDVVTAGSVAAAFVKRHEGVKALPKDVFVRRLGNAAPLPHAELIEIPPSDRPTLLFKLTRRQPLTADLYCEMYDPESKDVARVLVSDVGKSEDSLCGTEIVGSTSAVLDKDSPRWLPINAAKRLGLKYQPPEESKWTWERFLAEKGGRAAPMSCFRAMETLAGLVSECEATATVS